MVSDVPPETPKQCSVVSDGPPDLQRRDANMCYYFMLLFWVRKKDDDAWSELPVGGSCAFDHWHASSCRCMPRMLYPVGRLQLTSLHLVLACLDQLKFASPVAFNLLKYAND